MLYHVLVFAFLMVMLFTMVMTPILLFVFDLKSAGWHWQHAALFSAMIAPTDAVSVSSILKKGEASVLLVDTLSLYVSRTWLCGPAPLFVYAASLDSPSTHAAEPMSRCWQASCQGLQLGL